MSSGHDARSVTKNAVTAPNPGDEPPAAHVPVTKTLSGPFAAAAAVDAWVYVFEAPHAVKIGVTAEGPDARASRLQSAAGIPITIVAAFACRTLREATTAESRAHRALDDHRIYGEWFVVKAEQAVAVVREMVGGAAHQWQGVNDPAVSERRKGRPLAGLPRTLRDLRLARRWTLADLADVSGVNLATISQLERGRMVATNEELFALSEAFDLGLSLAVMVVHWEQQA